MQTTSRGDGASTVQPAAASLTFATAAQAVRHHRWAGWPAWTTVPFEMLELDAFDDAGNEIANPLHTERGK